MRTPKTPAGAVVVGIDGSEHARHALDWAIDQASHESRTLVLAHAVGVLGHPATTWSSSGDPDASRLRERLVEQSRGLLEDAVAHVAHRAPEVTVEQVIESLDPRELLIGLSDSAAMTIVGSRGLGPLRSLLLGSVGVAVARHAISPVVVVRPHRTRRLRRGVLVGADGTPGSLPVLEFAYRQASERSVPLTAMHCSWDAVAATSGPILVPDSDGSFAEARMLLAESVSGLGERYPDVYVSLKVARGLPDDCLICGSDRWDLIVVGRHAGRAWSRAVWGNVADSVVEHAATAVAVVPEK